MSRKMPSNIQTQDFDYTKLEPTIGDYLLNKEMLMRACVGTAYTELGRHLSEARDRLANNKSGVFEEWYTALGFKRDRVYSLINRYDYILRNSEDISVLESLPLSLSYEVSKPSAPKELKQAVLDGGITTHKQYREMRAKLKESEERIKSLQSALETELNKPAPVPEIITIEKTPPEAIDLMAKQKQELKEKQEALDTLNAELEEIREKGRDVRDLERKKRELENDIAEVFDELRLAQAENQELTNQATMTQRLVGPIGHVISKKGQMEQIMKSGFLPNERSKKRIGTYIKFLRNLVRELEEFCQVEEVIEYADYEQI